MSEQLGGITVDSGEIIVDGDGSGGDSGNVVDPSNVEPVKRGRGRPRKSDDGNSTSDGNKSGKSASARNTTRTNNSAKKASTVVNTDGLAFAIGIIGNFIAARSKMEALALDEDEQKQIAEATGNVLKLYEIPVSEKTAAWSGLAMTLGTIYGGKIAAIKLAAKLNKAAE